MGRHTLEFNYRTKYRQVTLSYIHSLIYNEEYYTWIETESKWLSQESFDFLMNNFIRDLKTLGILNKS